MLTVFIVFLQCRYDVRQIIANSGRNNDDVKDLIESIESSCVINKHDRLVLNKILGTYLYAEFGK